MPAAGLKLSSSGLAWAVLLAAIWLPVIYPLSAQWSLFPDYNYGWWVPGLCGYLALQKRAAQPPAAPPKYPRSAWGWLALTGLAYLGLRILLEANPLWRLVSYGLALAAVGLTLLAVYLAGGGGRVRHYFFPIAFFLVAVPWPSAVEQGVIQSLTRFNAAVVVELVNACGVPALLQGRVIEISTGLVGIERACSGIRSLQATLMLALFFGELYRLNGRGRGALLLAGPLLALGFNVVRTWILVLLAAHAGLPAMERWHDATGVGLLVGCFLCLWGVARVLGRKQKSAAPSADAIQSKCELFASAAPVKVLALVFGGWALLVTGLTEAWFRSAEVRGGTARTWTAQWPTDNPAVHTNILPAAALQILQCDRHSSAQWTEASGLAWQAFYLRWEPANSFYGRAKEALSKFHNPLDCLPASGLVLKSDLGPVTLPVTPDFALTFSRYVFTQGERELYVFFAQTEDLISGVQASTRLSHSARWSAAWARSRNFGQSNLEIALLGPENSAAALRVLTARLPELIAFPSAMR